MKTAYSNLASFFGDVWNFQLIALFKFHRRTSYLRWQRGFWSAPLFTNPSLIVLSKVCIFLLDFDWGLMYKKLFKVFGCLQEFLLHGIILKNVWDMYRYVTFNYFTKLLVRSQCIILHTLVIRTLTFKMTWTFLPYVKILQNLLTAFV